MKAKFKAGDLVRLIGNPEAKGHIGFVYEGDIYHVRFNDGSIKLCMGQELESD